MRPRNHDLDTFRYFEGSHRVIDREYDDIDVYIAGRQELDGTVRRQIVVDQLDADNTLTVAQARQPARVLISAADEIDSLSDPEGTLEP